MLQARWPDVFQPIIRAYACASRAAIAHERTAAFNALNQKREAIEAELLGVVSRRTELGSGTVRELKKPIQAWLDSVNGELGTARILKERADSCCKSAATANLSPTFY